MLEESGENIAANDTKYTSRFFFFLSKTWCGGSKYSVPLPVSENWNCSTKSSGCFSQTLPLKLKGRDKRLLICDHRAVSRSSCRSEGPNCLDIRRLYRDHRDILPSSDG